MEMWGKLISIFLVVIVVIIITITFSGGIYKVVGPILGLNTTLIVDEKISANRNTLDGLHKLFADCKQVSKTNCKCSGADKIVLEDGSLAISQADESIKLSVKTGNVLTDIKTIPNANYCYLNGVPRPEKNLELSDVNLVIDNGKLVNLAQNVGEMTNPIVLYKWHKFDTDFICVISSKSVERQINSESCF